jgi:hypothetical protein
VLLTLLAELVGGKAQVGESGTSGKNPTPGGP